MPTVIDVIFKPNGLVAYFDDGSRVEGIYRTIGGRISVIGISETEKLALQEFYLNRRAPADADIRFFALGQGISGAPGPPGPPGAGADATFNCPMSVSVRDAVYIGGSNFVDKASAELGAGQTGDSIGFVSYKPTSTTCVVTFIGLLGGFSGLVEGNNYFLSQISPGGITSTPPSVSGEKSQKLGVAASMTGLIVMVSPGIYL